MKRKQPPSPKSSGLTLIELMVTVAIVGVLLVLVAPSFQRLIATQRLRAVNAQLITDLQYARAEAAARNKKVGLAFDKSGSTYTCYVIFVVGEATDCNCNNPPGSVCTGTGELRTVQLERSSSVTVVVPPNSWSSGIDSIAYVPATGRLEVLLLDSYVPPLEPYAIEVSNASIGTFRNLIELTGRPTTCSPSGLLQGVTPCP